MKKKKNYIKIFGLSILVFIGFSFFLNITTVIAYYEYQNPDGSQTQICGFANTDIASCNARVKTECGATTTGSCVSSLVNCNSSMATTIICPTPDVQSVTGIETTDTSNTYTLLAPIGGMTTAPTNIGDYFNKIFLIAIGLCGALAVIMIVIGGVQYMGDESIFAKTEAKSQIKNAILGLLIALASYVLLNTINPDLLGKGGVNIQQVSAEILEAPMLQESTGLPAIGVALGTKGSCPEGRGGVVINNNVIMNTCKSISEKVTQMIILAKSNSINLSGSSFRSYSDQARARVNNRCPDVYTSPASACNPPTAIPGTSMHESGLAIDFKCDGVIIQTQDNKCFLWLKDNASTYGLINFAKEPWHWSTNGK